jgi:hypothetical protein
MGHDVAIILIAAGVGLVGKIVWDWLKLRRQSNGNGSTGERPVSFWENKLHGLGEDVQKGFRDSLQISVIPILNRQTEILDEMRADGKELSKAIVKLALRDEVREEMRRSKAANA